MLLCILLIISCVMGQINVIQAKEETKHSGQYELSQFRNNEMLIKFTSDCKEEWKDKMTGKCHLTILKSEKGYVLAKADNKKELQDAQISLNKDTYVQWVQPNFQYELASITHSGTYKNGNITFSKNQWGLMNDGTLQFTEESSYRESLIQAKQGIDGNVIPLWEAVSGKEGKSVTVAVVDTGVDIKHPGLQGRLWKNKKEIPDDGIDNDKNGYKDDYDGWNAYNHDSDVTDESDHGTHCAGIIAANGNQDVWGVTGKSKVKIMPVKVFSDSKKGDPDTCIATSYSILWGLEYAQANGADICNISLGMEDLDTGLRDFMLESKMLFVCAAGNDGEEIEYMPNYPAYYNFSNIISVANIRCDGRLHKSSTYSKKRVGVAAPGSEIYSTLPNKEYGYLTGTSMAAPYVTGVAALLYSYTNRMNAASAKKQIIQNATKLESIEKKVSGGLVNAYAAYVKDVSAPSIQYRTNVYKSKGYATVDLSVRDYGNAGVKNVRWLKGERTIRSFKKGRNGTRVSDSGKIRVNKTGVYTIYTMDKSGNETVRKVTVKIPVPARVDIKKTTVLLKRGTHYVLKPVAVPSGVYAKYTFMSSDKRIAAVDAKGNVTGKRAGAATITIKTQNGKKRTCKIKVL